MSCVLAHTQHDNERAQRHHGDSKLDLRWPCGHSEFTVVHGTSSNFTILRREAPLHKTYLDYGHVCLCKAYTSAACTKQVDTSWRLICKKPARSRLSLIGPRASKGICERLPHLLIDCIMFYWSNSTSVWAHAVRNALHFDCRATRSYLGTMSLQGAMKDLEKALMQHDARRCQQFGS